MNLLTKLIPGRADSPSLPKRHRRVQGVELKTEAEIEIMRQAARIVATVLKEIQAMVEPGMSTADLDAHAEKRIREMGATPASRATMAFRPPSVPASTMKSSTAFPTSATSFVGATC